MKQKLPSTPGPIGVFDSGYGGLTILSKIREALPEYDYIYLGDNARAPYGTRSFEVVYEFTLQAVTKLFEMGCHLVILACNTASAKALRSIQINDLPHLDLARRVLGVIRPTVECIGNITRSRHVGVLATGGTIKSESYPLEIHKLFPDIKVSGEACPLWVSLVENNEAQGDGTDYFVRKYINELLAKDREIDTAILGCTHYPILLPKIRKYMPESITIVSQGKLVADSLKDYLHRHPEIDAQCTRNGKCSYYTTEAEDKFTESASIFLNEAVTVQRIEQHEEELGDDEVAQPVRRRAEGGADAAHAQREDLADKHPGDRAPRDRKAEDIESDENHRRHGQHGHVAHEVHHGEHCERNGHHDGTEDQHALARETIHDKRGHDGAHEVHHADAHRHPDRVAFREAEALDEHLRQEVDHRVDAHELLEQHDTDGGHQRRTSDTEQFAHTTLGVLCGHGLDLVQLNLHLGLIHVLANQRKHFEGVAGVALVHQITRGFGQQQAAEQQQGGRHQRRTEHPAPVADAEEVVVQESEVGGVGQQNAEGDHELEQRGQRAATLLRRQFGQVRRGQGRSRADREAQDDAGAHHHRESGGGGAQA